MQQPDATPSTSASTTTAARTTAIQQIVANVSSITTSELNSQTSFGLRQVPAATATANTFSTFSIKIPGYASTTWLKTIYDEAL